jgi:4-amino-4-deoxy-L-arabinose transferase-like glycosyltransferase
MKRWVAIILVVGLVLRVAWWTQAPDESALEALPDQVEYLALGRSLLAGEGLSFHDRRFDQELGSQAIVFAHRTPGYPLFIAACGGRVEVIRGAQILLDVSSAAAMMLLARRLFGVRAAILAGALVAMNPYLIYFSTLILTESLYTSMLIWGMSLMLARDRRAGVVGLILLSLSVLVRPSMIALPTLLAGVAIFVESKSMRRALLSGLGAAVVTAVVLLPWGLRNHLVLGEWVFTTTNGGITLYDGIHSGATGASDQRFISSMPELNGMTEIERDRYLRNESIRLMRQEPTRAARLALKKVARTWSPVPLSGEYGNNVRNIILGTLGTVPLFVLTAIAVFKTPGGRSAKVFLLLPAIYITLAHALSVGSLRYRVPADVPMAVLAGAVLTRPAQRVSEL